MDTIPCIHVFRIKSVILSYIYSWRSDLPFGVKGTAEIRPIFSQEAGCRALPSLMVIFQRCVLRSIREHTWTISWQEVHLAFEPSSKAAQFSWKPQDWHPYLYTSTLEQPQGPQVFCQPGFLVMAPDAKANFEERKLKPLSEKLLDSP